MCPKRVRRWVWTGVNVCNWGIQHSVVLQYRMWSCRHCVLRGSELALRRSWHRLPACFCRTSLKSKWALTWPCKISKITFSFCEWFYSLHFNGHSPGEPGLASVYWSKRSGGDSWSYRLCKAPVKSLPPTNQHPVFYRPDALPVAQPTMSCQSTEGDFTAVLYPFSALMLWVEQQEGHTDCNKSSSISPQRFCFSRTWSSSGNRMVKLKVFVAAFYAFNALILLDGWAKRRVSGL